ncbi:MAG: cell surface protein SprA [Cyclobacteriaceae bacterium]|nr:cell surface protein SprA [Cyclobacteriaceae bacterium]UYN88616.1 MAG: cell surface protein SprA [Cyclobacteriaceae bacterium]
MRDPTKVNYEIALDSSLNYTIYEKIGDLNYRPITTMSFEEFKAYQDRQMLKGYWQGKSKSQDGESAVSSRGLIPKIYVSPVLDRIFGGSYVELVPRGFVTLDFGVAFQRIDNPNIPIRQQRNGGFEFDQQINMSVIGKVGEKLAVSANFDNNNSFDFQNNMKVEYTGFKEDILKKLEIGNVSLPLNNTLIQGSQNLFGVKAQLQFGKLFVTTIASTQRGKVASIDIPGGNSGQGRPFQLVASGYDENRHFFLGHFFRDNFQRWLANPPQIYSGINITRVEVYILNRNNDTRTLRNVVGLMDLAEPSRIYNSSVTPSGSNLPNANEANNLFAAVRNLDRNADAINGLLDSYFAGEGNNGTDYEKITGARILSPTEYTFHRQLGYITLTRKLQNDEAIAVAYEYTFNGRSYKVGELSEDYASRPDNEVVFLKLLRPRKVSIRDQARNIIPTWDLMMKNIYSLNVSQLTRENFQLRIIYRDDRTGIDNPQLQEGQDVRNRQLIEVFGLDKLNPVNDPQRDGNFDFVEGVTINTQTGVIIFPYLEPFNTALRDAFRNDPQETFLVQKYVFDTLYRTTRADAELVATKNKFFLVGTYSAGSSKEILIPGFGVSPGSVRVYAGGTPLMEGTEYTVDYTFGRVTILSDAILNSGKNISIQYEQADPFAFQTRSLVGTRFDYQLNDDISLGSTLLYYNERPLITRNAIGTEPARNLQYGFDFNVRKDSRLLTKIIDAIPGVQTKELSSINWSGEFAQLLPGTSNIVDGDGTAYIDDFENTATPYSLMSPQAWRLAAVPRDFDQTNGALNDTRAGFKRARLAWYIVDNQFYRDGGRFKPSNITSTDLENHYVRAVLPTEIFPKRNPPQGNFFEPVLDIAYYPRERGPYNYDNQRLTNTKSGYTPAEAKDNWAGITTAIRTEVDFDKANIEYVEFWMLDPFINNTERGRIIDGAYNDFNTTGGKLIFHLGSISEDVIRDGRHGFENGLPPDGDLTLATETPWGYVANRQYITNAFDNSPTARANQDVGWDGIGNQLERIKFSAFANLNPDFAADPSADDFQFYFGNDLDARNAKILERYKLYNGLENNTPINTGSDIPRSNGFLPDNEDLNADNTLNELEEYYEYVIDLRKSNLDIGKKYIVDKITPAENNPDQVTWYLFRIPVRNFDNRVGNIEGFKSIRYVRMVVTDFEQPVIMRMANFRLIGSRWRRYLESLEEGGLVPDPEPDFDNFTLSVVNIEENSAPDPSSGKPPYVLPPGFVRDRDNTSSIYRELNEQSVQVCIDNLKNGDARAIFKNVDMDFFNYGRIKMLVHANSPNAQDDDLHVFMRLGTDFDQNFYEVELPLKITPGTASAARDIWPSENEFDFALKDLYGLKAQRDREGFSLDELYPRQGPRQFGKHGVRVLGRPDLSNVRLIMIGVRNPRTTNSQPYSVCLWANELRLTDFDRTPGWAVNTTLNAKLADFAMVSGSMRYMTYGFGSVSSKISERTREETFAYDVTANVNVDKLLPGNHGIKVPMLVSYQSTTINPNYDPANPDQKLDAALASFNTQEEKDDYVKLIRDREVRRSLNFTNVRKTKVNPQAKTNLWDIENFSFSYRYSDNVRQSFTIAESLRKDVGGSVAYNFSPKGTGIEPFKNSEGFKSPYLKFIKDFNFSLLPSNIMVRGDLDRSFSKIIYRNALSNSESNFLKYFTFNRTYNLQWNLTKSLSLNYAARANAIIDEPEGDIDTREKRDSVITNLKRFGRMKNFDQSITANYIVPLDKFPITDWIGAEYRYQVNYNWKAGPVNRPDLPGEIRDLPDSLDFRNIIQNNRDQTVSGRLDMVKLYNKVGFLKKINNPPRPTTTRPQPNQKPDTVKTQTTPPLVKGFLRLLMSVRSINGTYTLTEGTLLPGFEPDPYLFGMDKAFNAPGWNFVLGSQNPNIRFRAAENNWLVRTNSLTQPFTQTSTRSITGRANVEPSADLKIQLDIKKDITDGYQEIFRFDDLQNGYISQSPSRYGSYKISTLSIRTSFRPDNNDLSSSVFKEFEENLLTVQEKFARVNPGFEYDSISQDVVIPAFIAAYTGKSADRVSLSPFPRTPLPGWRVDYNGLNKIELFKNLFQSITLTHAYSSTYSVLNYSNSLQYENVGDVGINVPIEKYNNGIYASLINDGRPVPIYVISQVLIAEQFQPLIGVNLRTKKRLTARAEYKTKRELALNVSNAQITEVSSKDVSMELGYTKNNMKLPIKSQGRTIVLKNDVTFRMNMTVSNQSTIQRKIEELNVLTNGNINFQLRPNISYVVNQKLNVQAYFERTINDPQVSNSFRRATTRFGVQVRFSLAQ